MRRPPLALCAQSKRRPPIFLQSQSDPRSKQGVDVLALDALERGGFSRVDLAGAKFRLNQSHPCFCIGRLPAHVITKCRCGLVPLLPQFMDAGEHRSRGTCHFQNSIAAAEREV
jgi:hypothetical protein